MSKRKYKAKKDNNKVNDDKESGNTDDKDNGNTNKDIDKNKVLR